MQVARGPIHSDLEGEDAAEAIGERRVLWARDAVVGDHDCVALEFGAIGFEERAEVFAADLLFAFDHEGQVARQFRARFEVGFDRVYVREVLTFIVARSAAKEGAVVDARLEGRGGPQIERLSGLDVVMAVNEIAGALRMLGSFRNDDWVSAGGADARLQADVAAMIVNPLRAGSDVLFMMALRGDAGEAHVVAQLANEAVAVLVQIIQSLLHRGYVAMAG